MAEPNESIDRYQLREKIGAGGMGTVYHAWDREIERDVALKWLPESFSADPNFVERFRREARFIARLEHPHIVPIYDVGQYQGRPFLIMRLLSGGTLRDRLMSPDFDLTKVMTTMSQIADALTAAHSRHIIHRDIKPGNILFDDRNVAFLSDFGVAKLLDAATMLTGSGVVGTPAYMSPEQFIGQEIDGRSDQYALAVVLYEALSGQLPFEGNTVQMMYKHLNTEPSEIDLAKLPALAGMNHILKKALSKNPDDRYPTAQAFVDEAEITDGLTRNQRILLPLAAPVPRPPSAMVTPYSRATPAPSPMPPGAQTIVDTPSQNMRQEAPPPIIPAGAAGAAAASLSGSQPAPASAGTPPAINQPAPEKSAVGRRPPPGSADRTIVEPLSWPQVVPPPKISGAETPSSASPPTATPATATPPGTRSTRPPVAVPLAAAPPAAATAAPTTAPAGAAARAVAPPAGGRGLPGWVRAAAGVLVLLLVIAAGWWLFSGIGGNASGNDPTPDPGTSVPAVVVGADATATVEPTALASPTDAIATPTSTLPPTATEAVAAGVLVRVVTATDLYEGPGIAYPVVGAVAAGDQLEVIGRTAADDWYNVITPTDQRAWIAKSVVTPLDKNAIAGVPVAATVPAAPEATAEAATATVALPTLTLPAATLAPTQAPPTQVPPTQVPPTNPPPPTDPPPPPPTDPPPPPPTDPPPPPPTDPPPPPATYTPEPP